MKPIQSSYAKPDPNKPGVEETQVQIHRIRITLTSPNVKSLEKGINCSDICLFSKILITLNKMNNK